MEDEQKQVYFVRHGHSTYNEWRDRSFSCWTSPPCSGFCIGDPLLFDAGLSETGRQQVLDLPAAVRAAGLTETVELIVCSPLSRAIETALGGFEQIVLTSRAVPLVACGLAAEVVDTACDIGKTVPALQQAYPQVPTPAVRNAVRMGGWAAGLILSADSVGCCHRSTGPIQWHSTGSKSTPCSTIRCGGMVARLRYAALPPLTCWRAARGRTARGHGSDCCPAARRKTSSRTSRPGTWRGAH